MCANNRRPMISCRLGLNQGAIRDCPWSLGKAPNKWFFVVNGGQGNSAEAFRLCAAIAGVALEKVDNPAGNIDAGSPFDPFQPG